MKKIVFIISAIIATVVSAQESHVTVQKGFGTNFIPASLRSNTHAALHIYAGKTIDVYDNDISLIKNIEADSISVEYLSATARERQITGAICSEIIKGEELTDIYRNYIPSFDSLTRNEKIDAIIKHEENNSGTRSTSKIILFEPHEGITFFGNREYSYNFFASTYLGEKYPKGGIMLDEEEKIFRFNALYEFTYSEWGEFQNEYQTLSGKGALLAQYIDTDNNSSANVTFYITQTLFDQDGEYEYIRPVYTACSEDTSIDVYLPSSYSEIPITSEGENFYKNLAISGIEIVKENGKVLHSITFDDNYETIGDLSSISGNIVKAGTDITILKMGEYKYMTFDTTKEDENCISIYKHFYKIENITSTIKQVKAPALIKITPSIPDKDCPFQIEVDCNHEGKIIINSTQGLQQQQENINSGKSIINISAIGKSGTYIATQIENGTITETKKFFVK